MDGQAMENEPGASMSSLGMPLPDISTCSPTQMLSELCPSGILWRLHYIGTIGYIIGHWAFDSISSPSSLPGSGTESSRPLITILALLATSPHP